MKKTLKQTRRIAAILLCMCLVFAMMPAAAFAGTQDLEVSAGENGRYTYENGKVKSLPAVGTAYLWLKM